MDPVVDHSRHLFPCLGSGRPGRPRRGSTGPDTGECARDVAGRGGRGGDPSGGASEFYNYDTTAGSEPAIPDAPPAETHQKITVNGEALAYTARAGYMPLRNATTGQSEAHLFYTSYAKDGVSRCLGRVRYCSSSAARRAWRPPGRSSADWARSG